MSYFTKDDKSVRVNGRKAKTFQEWQELRRSNPKHYYNAATQRKVVQDAEALGAERFYAKEDE